MARPGRKPKPTSLKLLHGTRRDRINSAEPAPSPAELFPPDHLEPAALEEWHRLADDLAARAGVTHWDAQVLGLHCSAVAKLADAERLLAGAGALVRADAFDRNGRPTGHRVVPNPAWRIWKDSADVVMRTASVLGLKPADRTRLATNPASDDAGVRDPNRLLS